MNFVGKVLVVLQVVLSVCFMAFAGAVYTTHVNWKQRHDEVQTNLSNQIDTLRNENADLQGTNDQLTADLVTARNEIGALQAENANLGDQLTTTEEALKQEQESSLKEQGVAEIAKIEAQHRKEEAEAQRQRNETLLQSRNQLVTTVRNLEDQLFSRETELKRILGLHNQLLQENHVFRSILVNNGMSTDPSDYTDQQPPPPDVEGVVLATRRGRRSGTQFVEISIGRDDGLEEGHQLHVYRMDGKAKYLGKVNIVFVEPDRAVGTLSGGATNGAIKRGDHVATKL